MAVSPVRWNEFCRPQLTYHVETGGGEGKAGVHDTHISTVYEQGTAHNEGRRQGEGANVPLRRQSINST